MTRVSRNPRLDFTPSRFTMMRIFLYMPKFSQQVLFAALFAALAFPAMAEEQVLDGVAAGAVDAVQFQLFFKMRARHEPPQPRGAH